MKAWNYDDRCGQVETEKNVLFDCNLYGEDPGDGDGEKITERLYG